MQANVIKPFVPPQGNAEAALKAISKQFNRQVKKWNGGKQNG